MLRGESVVESLKEVATRTQRPILSFLANANAEVTPFWIVNTIKVTTADEQLIRWLAAMPDVAAIKADQTWRIPEPQPGAPRAHYTGRGMGCGASPSSGGLEISLALKVKASL